jgi:hypothetical protein
VHDDLLNCATYSLGIIGTIKDLLFMINRKLFSVLEARLVETVQVGEMDSQPHQAAFTERFLDPKRQQTSSEIITDRVQMRRNRVGSTTEIEVMWDVKDVVEVLLADRNQLRARLPEPHHRLTDRAISKL